MKSNLLLSQYTKNPGSKIQNDGSYYPPITYSNFQEAMVVNPDGTKRKIVLFDKANIDQWDKGKWVKKQKGMDEYEDMFYEKESEEDLNNIFQNRFN